MAPKDLGVSMEYVPGGTDDVERFRRELSARRGRDLQRGAMTFGPQRDEVLFRVGGRPARTHASQGQQRLLTLAVKVAELGCVKEATGLEPILLLDDVSSELDPDRTESVFQFLRRTSSQVFVTTTRPELFDGVEMDPSQRANFRMQKGRLNRL
jgi:DNA replication and repair protein RecF